MGKVVVSEFVTLDGVFQDPGGAEGFAQDGWSFRFDQGSAGCKFKLAELMAAGALLLDRVTYQGFPKPWPSMTDEVGFADKMNGIAKYVVSTTLNHSDWNNSTVIRGDVSEAVSALKQVVEGEILIAGSGQLVQTLMGAGLIDEYRLMVFPMVLGTGRHWFDGANEASVLRLVSTQKAGDCLILIYQPADSAPGES